MCTVKAFLNKYIIVTHLGKGMLAANRSADDAPQMNLRNNPSHRDEGIHPWHTSSEAKRNNKLSLLCQHFNPEGPALGTRLLLDIDYTIATWY